MAAEKRVRTRKGAEATDEPRYEIKVFNEWHAVDRGNVLKDGCLHWEIGDSYGIAQKGKWRVAR